MVVTLKYDHVHDHDYVLQSGNGDVKRPVQLLYNLELDFLD